MPKASQPELKKVRKGLMSKLTLKYMDKRLFVQLNGSRKVIGVLRGYDVCFLLSVF
jgi:small nuclear ribonucleoprotein (snRNP)-like protein